VSHGVAAAGAGPAHRLGEAPPRFPELDGIRGFAALAVLLFHVGPESFGAVMPELRSPWVFPWINGHRAVLLFFVLSGDALASACLRAASPAGIARLALRRYVRLTGPIVLSSLIIYGLMKYGLMFHREAAQQVASPWLWGFLNFEPTFAGLFIYTLRDVYFGFAAPTPYNGFLWTMMVELSGSYYVFLACFMLPYVKRPPYLVALVAALMLAFGSYYGLFFVGVLFALWRRDGPFAARTR
jgi:peptidoglycan/LPS O-acetylase OafA/YrhL